MTQNRYDILYFPPIGSTKSQIPTPALLIDLPALEFNLSLMSSFFKNRLAKLRPHFKTHKCSAIAKKQMDYGAIGITCAKLSEAEVLVDAGIPDILIANQVVDPIKIRRMAELAERCHIIVAIDNFDNLISIAKAAKEAGTVIDIVIEVDVGLHRSGVQPGKPALDLAQNIGNLPGVKFLGLLGYEGFTMFELDKTVRLHNSHQAMNALIKTSEVIQNAGIPMEIVSAGGTGTYNITGDFPGVTEIEAGSYVFMDTKYSQLGLGFKHSLTLLSTVTSYQSPKRCIIDAGMKVLSSDNGLPKVISPENMILHSLNEEHGIAWVDADKILPEIGTRVEIIPSHACTTVNLHDRYYILQEGKLVDIWEIDGRGKSQ